MYNANNQIKFITSMLRSSLCDCSDAYILVSGTVKVPNTWEAANPNKGGLILILKHFKVCGNTIEMNHF